MAAARCQSDIGGTQIKRVRRAAQVRLLNGKAGRVGGIRLRCVDPGLRQQCGHFGGGVAQQRQVAISEALRPIGKPAPPRPRRFALPISSISASEVFLRAFSSAL